MSALLAKISMNFSWAIINMHIWIDADACPKVIKEILFRAAVRTKTPLTLVANSFISYPNSPFIRSVQVTKGFDSADHYIMEHVQPFDLVITADIPLAAEVIAKKGWQLILVERNITKRPSNNVWI